MVQAFLFALVLSIFYWVYKSYSRYQREEYSPSQFRNVVLTRESLARSELGLFVALVAKVAKADGRVDELEAELVGNMFNDISAMFPDPRVAKEILKEIFSLEKQSEANIEEIALSLYALTRNDLHKRLWMIQFLVNLAYIDGTLSHSEETMIRHIAGYLRFSEADLSTILEQFGSLHRHSVKESSIDGAYTMLGIAKESSDDEVKKAYRALVKQYHPDVVKAQGASDDYIRTATAKVQEINAAYEMIKKSRGL